MGAYHTLDLEINRKFTLSKPEWDSVSLDRVDMACDPTQVIDGHHVTKKNVTNVTINQLNVELQMTCSIKAPVKPKQKNIKIANQSFCFIYIFYLSKLFL